MNTRRAVFALGMVLAGVPGFAPAHHSLSGQFDVTKGFSINGTVSRVEWVNPHVYIYVDVHGAGGAVTTYKLESLPVAMMRKAGVSKQSLLGDGTPVSIQAHPARNGTATLGYLITLKYADGREIQFANVPGAEKP